MKRFQVIGFFFTLGLTIIMLVKKRGGNFQMTPSNAVEYKNDEASRSDFGDITLLDATDRESKTRLNDSALNTTKDIDSLYGEEDFKKILSKSWYWEADPDDRSKVVEERDKAFVKFMNDIQQIENTTQHRLPKLITLGVEKCGTGALLCMMETHPMLRRSFDKECHFFTKNSSYSSGIEHYLRQFPSVKKYEMLMEKSPSYFTNEMYIPHRIKKHLPDAKFVVVVCDPINRTYSDYVQEIWTEKLSPRAKYSKVIDEKLMNVVKLKTDVLRDDDDATSKLIFDLMKKDYTTHIITHGLYYYHLKRWLNYYSRDKFLILNGDDLQEKPWDIMDKVQEFLQIPKFITKENFVRTFEKGFYYSRPLLLKNEENDEKLVTYGEPYCTVHKHKGRTRLGNWKHKKFLTRINTLKNFYKPYNEKLFKLIGERYNWQ